MKIINPYEVAGVLWEKWLRLDVAGDEKIFELDLDTQREMYNDERFYINFTQISENGEPCMTYRDGWKCKRIAHLTFPKLVESSEVPTKSVNDITPHMALAFTKPNGRRVYLDWEGNHEDLT